MAAVMAAVEMAAEAMGEDGGGMKEAHPAEGASVAAGPSVVGREAVWATAAAVAAAKARREVVRSEEMAQLEGGSVHAVSLWHTGELGSA